MFDILIVCAFALSSSGNTDLVSSVKHDSFERVVLVIKSGAAVDSKDEESSTPCISWAIKLGKNNVAQLLLSTGADPNLTDKYGWSPLMIAISSRNFTAIELLLKNSRLRLDARNYS